MFRLAALAIAQLANPGFELGLDGWRASADPGMEAVVARNQNYTTRGSYEGEHFLVMGWRARNGAPPGAAVTVETSLDARPYRGRSIRVSAMTRAPDYARNVGRVVALAGATHAEIGIAASIEWLRHGVTLTVPVDADRIDIGFGSVGTSSELEVDDVRLELLP